MTVFPLFTSVFLPFFEGFFVGLFLFFEFLRKDPIWLLWRSGTCLICYAR